MRLTIFIPSGIISRALTLASVLAMLVNPAYAGDWLVFRDGATRTTEHWSGKVAPIPGVNVPADAVVKVWDKTADDRADNYKLSAGVAVLDPPQPVIQPVIEPTKEELRKTAYQKELGDIGNQFDAIYKGVKILVPALVKAGLLAPEEIQALTPDKNADPDTPAGWLGKIEDIKERFPKEGG